MGWVAFRNNGIKWSIMCTYNKKKINWMSVVICVVNVEIVVGADYVNTMFWVSMHILGEDDDDAFLNKYVYTICVNI